MGDVVMDDAQVRNWVRAERLALADFLETLTPGDWATPSLCPGWTIHDVLAHVSTTDTLRETLVAVLRAKGNWNRMNAELATTRAARHAPAELLTELRAFADSTRRAPGAGVLDPLVDIIVHGQDIARPLARPYETPVDRVVPALDYAIASRFYGAKKRFRATRLTATDTDWTYGEGPEDIEAPAIDLLLLATGRPA
ncbi:maleylpyruvate isomerase family mycothiol-dependent enzyme [Nocardia ignorata]|uniref:maleylpyruvate isomerase family mycothiol-dependent enzyme n=1 Tax=Nocardia ignorata TaxID=145285 RepID=UPI00362D4AF5